MYRQLWEREADALLIKYGVNVFVHIEINSPVVLTLHPGTDDDIHTACIERMKGDERCRVTKNPFIFGNDAAGGFFYFIKVFAILYANHPLYAAGIFAAVVGHRTTA